MKALVTAPNIPGRVRTVDAPPPDIAPGVAVVRVFASSINRGELRLIGERPDGWAPGQDLAGVVEAAAPDGGPAAGTRVVGLADGGSWSELVAVPVERLAVLPPTVSFTAGGALPVVGLTALRALRALGDVVGRDLLVTGASGAVGNVAARLALLAGARVTGLARRHVTIEGVRFVTALAAEDRFHRVIDAVGGDVLSDALRHLRPDARVVFFGILTGSPTRFDLATFYGSSPRSTISPLFVFDAPGRFDDDLAVLVRFVEEKRLTPVIDRAFSSDAVNEALEAMSSSAAGKIVLTRDSAPQ